MFIFHVKNKYSHFVLCWLCAFFLLIFFISERDYILCQEENINLQNDETGRNLPSKKNNENKGRQEKEKKGEEKKEVGTSDEVKKAEEKEKEKEEDEEEEDYVQDACLNDFAGVISFRWAGEGWYGYNAKSREGAALSQKNKKQKKTSNLSSANNEEEILSSPSSSLSHRTSMGYGTGWRGKDWREDKKENRLSEIWTHFDNDARRISIRRIAESKSLLQSGELTEEQDVWKSKVQQSCSKYNFNDKIQSSEGLVFQQNGAANLYVWSLATGDGDRLDSYFSGETSLIENIKKFGAAFYVLSAIAMILLLLLFLSCCSFSKLQRQSLHILTCRHFFRDRPRAELEEISKRDQIIYFSFYFVFVFLAFFAFFASAVYLAVEYNYYMSAFSCGASLASYEIGFGKMSYLSDEEHEVIAADKWRGLQFYLDFSKDLANTVEIASGGEKQNQTHYSTLQFQTYLAKELFGILGNESTNESFLSLKNSLSNTKNILENLNVNHNCYFCDNVIDNSENTKKNLVEKFEYEWKVLENTIQNTLKSAAPPDIGRVGKNVQRDIEELNKSVFDVFDYFDRSDPSESAFNIFVVVVVFLCLPLPSVIILGWLFLHIRYLYAQRRETPSWMVPVAGCNSICFGLYAACCFAIGGWIISFASLAGETCNFVDSKLFDKNMYLEYPRLSSLLPTNKNIIDHCLWKNSDGDWASALAANSAAFTSPSSYETLSNSVGNVVGRVDVPFFKKLSRKSQKEGWLYVLDTQSALRQNKGDLLQTYDEVLQSGVQWRDELLTPDEDETEQNDEKKKKEKTTGNESNTNTPNNKGKQTAKEKKGKKPRKAMGHITRRRKIASASTRKRRIMMKKMANASDRRRSMKNAVHVYGLEALQRKINDVASKYANSLGYTFWCFAANPNGCPHTEGVVIIDANTNVFTDVRILQAVAQIAANAQDFNIAIKWRNALYWVVEKHKILESEGYICLVGKDKIKSCDFVEFSGVSFHSTQNKNFTSSIVKHTQTLYDKAVNVEAKVRKLGDKWEKKVSSIMQGSVKGLSDLEEADCNEGIFKPLKTAVDIFCRNANPHFALLGVLFCCLATLAIIAWILQYKMWHYLYDRARLTRQLFKLRSLKEKVKNRKRVQADIAIYNNDDIQFMMQEMAGEI